MMTTIRGMLEGKRLSLEKTGASVGEAGDIQLEISLTPEENVTYYLEFLCPYGRKYLSAGLLIEDGIINYTLPNFVFLSAGRVYAQLIGLKNSAVIFKSVKAAAASIEILPSVNGAEEVGEQSGFLIEAEATLSLARETIQSAQQKIDLLDEKAQELETIVQAVAQNLDDKVFEGKSAYAYAVEGGFSGSEEEFSESLAQMDKIVEDAPEGGCFLRERGGWINATTLPEPSPDKIGGVPTVIADGDGAKYALLPVCNEAQTIQADSEELITLARTEPLAVFYGNELCSADIALNGEGNFELRFILTGEVVIQIIDEKKRGIRYKRTKTGSGAYSTAEVEPIIPLKIENVQLLPDMFIRKELFFEAKLDLKELCGYNIADSVMPVIILSDNSRMIAYTSNLNKQIILSGGQLLVRAAIKPDSVIAGDIVLIGTN